MVCCLYSLEWPHRGDCNEYTQHTIILKKIEKKKIEKISLLCTCPAAMINIISCNYPCLEVPKVLVPLKFYCTQLQLRLYLFITKSLEKVSLNLQLLIKFLLKQS